MVTGSRKHAVIQPTRFFWIVYCLRGLVKVNFLNSLVCSASELPTQTLHQTVEKKSSVLAKKV